MTKRSIVLSLSLLIAVLAMAQSGVATANQDTKPNPPIPSDVAQDLLVPGAPQDDRASVENPPIPQDVANALMAPDRVLPRTSASP